MSTHEPYLQPHQARKRPNTQFEDQTDYDRQVAFFEALLPEAGERAQVLLDNPAKLFGFDVSR